MSKYRTKDEDLQRIGTSIANLESNPTLAAKLQGFGFTNESLAEGKLLFATATQKSQKQKMEEGEQHSATERCNKLFGTDIKVEWKINRRSDNKVALDDFNTQGGDAADESFAYLE